MATLTRVVEYARSLPILLGRVDSRAYVPELDGLRFLAIMFVLVWHASLRAARYIDHANATGPAIGNFYRFFPHGEIGVALFFFISGFVVSQPFVAKPRAQWKVGAYYKRRFMRIYPPYLIAITICFVVLAVVGHTPVDANAFKEGTVSLNQSFAASLVYMHGIVFDSPSRLNPPMWSLEIEVLFYAVLPLLMMVYCWTPSRRVRIGLMSAMIVLAVAASSAMIQSTQTDLRLRWGLFYHAYLFLMGIVAADLAGDAVLRPHRKGTVYDLVFLGGVGALVGLGLLMTKNDARMLNSLYALEVQALTILSLVLIFTGAFRGRLASRCLSLGWVRLIGTMCYSLYLTHIIVMTAAGEVLAKVLHTRDAALIYLVYLSVLVSAALVVGGLFYVCVERPFARHLSKRKPDSRSVAIPGAVGAGPS